MKGKKIDWYDYSLRIHPMHKKGVLKYAEMSGLSLNDTINIAIGALLMSEKKSKKPIK